MTKYNAYMPEGKRVYKAYMPEGKRVYNVRVELDEFIRSPCRFIPNYTVADDPINVWYISDGLSVVQNGSQWDITDNTNLYETLNQMSEVAPITSSTQVHHTETVVDKEVVDDHFLMIQHNQYENWVWGGSNTLLSEYRSAFNLVTGATSELLNPGGITNYVEDLGSQWKFIMEFNRNEEATHILTQVYPAGGTVFPNQIATATGKITADCIHGYFAAYTPP